MLTYIEYYELVMKGFNSLRKDINEAEEFTLNQLNEVKTKEEQMETADGIEVKQENEDNKND